MRLLMAVLVFFALISAAPIAAQSAVPQAMGVADNYTALARGFAASSYNPANLALSNNPAFSLTVLPVRADAGVGPIPLSDVSEYSGRSIPHAQRQQWLDRIAAEGGLSGRVGSDITGLGLSIGRVAVSATSRIRGRVNAGPDVAELILFGNAGRTGEPGQYSLENARIEMAATSTLAASIGVPLRLFGQTLAVGVTGKYVVGHGLIAGQETASAFSADPLAASLRFPLLHTPVPDSAGSDLSPREILDNGRGWGLDVGVALESGPLTASAALRDVVSTFEWDPESFVLHVAEFNMTSDTSTSSFEERPIEEAPEALRRRIEAFYGPAPALHAAAALEVGSALTVTGEVRHAFRESLQVGERTHVGVGAELRLLPFLPLRAGVAKVSTGYQLGAGAGLHLFGLQVGASGLVRETSLGSDVGASVGLTIGLR